MSTPQGGSGSNRTSGPVRVTGKSQASHTEKSPGAKPGGSGGPGSSGSGSGGRGPKKPITPIKVTKREGEVWVRITPGSVTEEKHGGITARFTTMPDGFVGDEAIQGDEQEWLWR